MAVFVRDSLLAWAQAELDDHMVSVRGIMQNAAKHTTMVGMNSDISWYFADVIRDAAMGEEIEVLVEMIKKRPEQVSDVDTLAVFKTYFQKRLLTAAQSGSQSTNPTTILSMRGKVSALASIVEALNQVDLVMVGLGDPNAVESEGAVA